MNLDTDKLHSIFEKLTLESKGFLKAKLAEEDYKKLINLGVPPVIVSALSLGWPSESVWINTSYLHGIGKLYTMNEQDAESLKNRYFIFGAASNGDPLVIKYDDGAVGFLNHETLWSGSPEELDFAYVDSSLGNAVMKLYSDDHFPFDYYDAAGE